MGKINFPSTENAPTDGSFKYNNNGRTWVWNGVYWETPREDDISYDSVGEVITYTNKLGLVKTLNLSFVGEQSLEDLAISIETGMAGIVLDSAAQPTSSSSSSSFSESSTFTSSSQDLDKVQRISDALTIKINELKNAINQMKSLQIDIQNSLGGDQYSPLYNDTTNLIQDINRLKQEKDNLVQSNLDVDSLISSIKSNISGGSDWTGISDPSNTVRDEILYVSQKMDDIKGVVENSGIDPNTDIAALITDLNNAKQQLLQDQASGQGVTLDSFGEAFNAIPQMEDDIENIRVSVGLDSAFEYSSPDTSETTIKGHIAELHSNKIDADLKDALGGIAVIDSAGKIVRETVTSLEYNSTENKLIYTDERDSANEIVLQDILTTLTYEVEDPNDATIEKYNRLVYTDENGDPFPFYIKGKLTSLRFDTSLEQIAYTDEEGNVNYVPIPQQITELYYDNITDRLIFENESGAKKPIDYPRVDRKTKLRYDDNEKQLIYTNEADVDFRVEFPDTLTTLEIDSNNDLIYTDENGVSHIVNIPETQTKIELDSAGLLVHTNEEGVQPAIDIRTNKVWLSSPGNPKEGDLYYVEDSTGLRVYVQGDWKRAGYAEIATDRIVSSSGIGSIIANEDHIRVNSNLTVEGNVEINGNLSFYRELIDSAAEEIDFIELVTDLDPSQGITIGSYNKFVNDANYQHYSPKLTVNDDPIVTSSNRSYILNDSNQIKKVDLSVSNHFISFEDSTNLLWLDDGIYQGQEMNFILEGGQIEFQNSVKIVIKNAIFTGRNSSESLIQVGGMEQEFSSSTLVVGETFDNIKTLQIISASVDSAGDGVINEGIIWHLNEIKPVHRQQVSGDDDIQWIYRNNSPLIYNCIWNGSKWILNRGNVQRVSLLDFSSFVATKEHWE